MTSALADEKPKDFEDIPIEDDATKIRKPLQVEQVNRCTIAAERCPHCGQKLGLIGGMKGFGFFASGHKARCQLTFVTKTASKASLKAPPIPLVKIGKRNVDITANYGIDVSAVVESKLFKELVDSLAKKKNFEVLKIQIQSVVSKPRNTNCNYIVTHSALPVNETQRRTSVTLTTLNADTVIKVLDIAEEDEDGRIRARIESPAGWVSLSHHKGTVYAKQQEVANDIVSLECSVDAKIDGHYVPGILFVRGSAIAILIVLHTDGAERQNYALLVRQDGVPNGLAPIVEIPSGSIDDDGNFVGAVAKDIQEKIGMEIKQSDLVDVTTATYKDNIPDMFPSCGSQKFDKVFVLQERTTNEDLESLKSSLSNQGEGVMRLHLEPLETEGNDAGPARSLYEKLKASGGIREVYSKEWHIGTTVGAAMGQFVKWIS